MEIQAGNTLPRGSIFAHGNVRRLGREDSPWNIRIPHTNDSVHSFKERDEQLETQSEAILVSFPDTE